MFYVLGIKKNQTLTSIQIRPNTVSKDGGQYWLDKAIHYGGWVATNDTIGHCNPSDGVRPVHVRPAAGLALR